MVRQKWNIISGKIYRIGSRGLHLVKVIRRAQRASQRWRGVQADLCPPVLRRRNIGLRYNAYETLADAVRRRNIGRHCNTGETGRCWYAGGIQTTSGVLVGGNALLSKIQTKTFIIKWTPQTSYSSWTYALNYVVIHLWAIDLTWILISTKLNLWIVICVFPYA